MCMHWKVQPGLHLCVLVPSVRSTELKKRVSCMPEFISCRAVQKKFQKLMRKLYCSCLLSNFPESPAALAESPHTPLIQIPRLRTYNTRAATNMTDGQPRVSARLSSRTAAALWHPVPNLCFALLNKFRKANKANKRRKQTKKTNEQTL